MGGCKLLNLFVLASIGLSFQVITEALLQPLILGASMQTQQLMLVIYFCLVILLFDVLVHRPISHGKLSTTGETRRFINLNMLKSMAAVLIQTVAMTSTGCLLTALAVLTDVRFFALTPPIHCSALPWGQLPQRGLLIWSRLA